MKKLLITTLLVCAFGGKTIQAQNTEKKEAPQKSAISPQVTEIMAKLKDLFQRLDANGDGKLSFEEFKVAPMVAKDGEAKNKADFKEMDANGDGFVTLEEFSAFVLKQMNQDLPKLKERAEATKSLSNGKQVMLGLRAYAADFNGDFPKDLNEMVKGKFLPDDKLLKVKTVDGEMDWVYPKGLHDTDNPNIVLLASPKPVTGDGKYIIVSVGGSAQLVSKDEYDKAMAFKGGK